ncbi:ATP-dependent DNA ligase [Gonapodya prolifera JEL478]|uniref:DNA ligase n=1 Tax=Gonapodya prolifera (strain JEL478) TaxID=1344416 RepID=A0A139ANK9_GONPJ|nr:ATP-dependent DNA ligase [Gonapodya prolifera JEL478]|eukprot:KXS18341.1 ATP-dependent DNA ligase [Gonapodya prolifera JEL478]
MQKWRREVKGTMYPALRLLMPNVDRGRLYNMKEVMLGRSYLEVMGIPKDSEDGQALVKFNLPGKSTVSDKAAGDFPRVLYEIVRSRSTVTESKVSIKKINEMLDNFARDHDKSEQRPIIREWVETLTAEEHMWLAKIILKQMKLGVSEQTILEAFHPDARELFTVNADLRTLCEKLYSVSFRLNNTSISVATAFKPQLSKMGNYTTLTHIDEWMGQLGCKEFWIETKLDGERMQIHIDNGQWRYYSRKGTNYTQDYGPDPTRGSLTPFIHNSINAHVKRCILDGELVVYDPASDALVPFGNLKTVGRKSFNPMNEHEPHPYFVAFDILQMDNVSLAEKPLHRRYEVLQSIIDPIPGRIAIIDQLRGTSSAQALHAFHAAIEAGQEGIIVKNPESRYVPNSRTMDWTKVKAEYVEGVSEHPDVVVVGGYYGTGNRANKISKFLVAIRDTPKQDEVVDPERPKLLTFARVGSGASYKELDAMTQRFPWKRFDDKRVPSWLAIGKEKPEMILDPYTKVDGVDSAIVLELKAAEITPADDYSCGYSLRFPRIMKSKIGYYFRYSL